MSSLFARLNRSFSGLRNPYAPLLAGFVLLLGLIAAIVLTTNERGAQNDRVRTLLQTRAELWQALSALQDMETGQRGYLLTGKEHYLTPFNSGSERLRGQLAALETDLAGSPTQQANLERLRALSERKTTELQRTIELYRLGRREQALELVDSDAGIQLMDEVRSTFATMLAIEHSRLRSGVASVERANLAVQTATIITVLSAILLGLLTVRSSRRASTDLALSRDAAQAAYARLVQESQSRERAEDQVRQMQKMEAVGQLTGGIAHDFNNMLAVITSALSLMQRRLASGDHNIGSFIDAAQDAAHRAGTLTSRLLAYSRRSALQPVTLDLNKLVSGMSELLRRTLGEQVVMETVLAGGLWRTHADASQLENAIINLCVNARDAMPEGGRLTIETANAHIDDDYASRHADVPTGQYVLVAVTDTGAGMAPDVAQRAFDPFFTTKPVGRGTGLGLSQVFGYVKQSNGHVKIYSEVGQGTTIKVYLPRSHRAEEEERPASEVVTARPAQAGEVILVVEDDARVRALSVAALRELGYTTLHAPGPEEALTMLDANPGVALLFTDIVMPVMSGRALADRALPRHPGLKVLYTTGYTQNAVVHNGVLDPGAQLLMKPFTLDQLAAKVRDVLDGK